MILTSNTAPPLDLQQLEIPSSFTVIVDWNDSGVLALREGKNMEALSYFQQALDHVQLHQLRGYQETDNISSNTVNENWCVNNYVLHRRVMSILHTMGCELRPVVRSASAEMECATQGTSLKQLLGSDSATSPSNCFAIFDRALLFERSKENLLNWFRCLPHVPAILLYNMGLTYHRMGIRSGLTKEFQQAYEFYRVSLHTLEDNSLCGMYTPDFNLLLLALLNNMGHINSHFFDLQQSVHCQQQMLTIFITTDCPRLVTKEEYIFFYMNLLLFLNRWPMLAPAA